MDAISIARSGLTAATNRMTLSASNIVRAQTVEAQPQLAPPPASLTPPTPPPPDVTDQLVEHLAAVQAFKANLKVIETADGLEDRTIQAIR